jgi:photosystem II stability/assembly factor-like uncharacterized protein
MLRECNPYMRTQQRYKLTTVYMKRITTAWLQGVFLILASISFPSTSSAQWGWDEISLPVSSDIYDLHFNDLYNGWAVTFSGEVLYTNDGGDTWALQHAEPDVLLKSVYFIDANTGWAGGQDYMVNEAVVLHTTNGGQNWTLYPIPWTTGDFQSINFLHAFNANNLIIFGHWGLMAESSDAGQTWNSINTLPIDHHWSAEVIDQDTIYLASAGGIYKTTDGTLTWSSVNGGDCNDVDFIDPQNGFFAMSSGVTNKNLRTTTDFGATTNNISPIGSSSSVAVITALTMDTLFVGMDDGEIYRSDDGGANWMIDRPFENNRHLKRLKQYNGSVWATGNNAFLARRGFNPLTVEANSTADIQISVWPNPCATTVTVGSDSDQIIQSIRLLTPYGQLIREEKLVTGEIQWSMQTLAPGLYLLEVTAGESSQYVKLLKR